MNHISSKLRARLCIAMGLGSITLSSGCENTKEDSDISDTTLTEPSIEDSSTPSGMDADGDGFGISDGDCDDGNSDIYPTAEEFCDGIDNNCSGDETDAIDTLTLYADTDNDSFGDPDAPFESCDSTLSGHSTNDQDCNDEQASQYPGADEYCNDIDDDCDTEIDEDALNMLTWYVDSDNDGFGDDNNVIYACDPGSGHSELGGDCDDRDALISPGETETRDLIDNNCNRLIDEMACAQAIINPTAALVENNYYNNGVTGPYLFCEPFPTDGSACQSISTLVPKNIVTAVIGTTPPTSFGEWDIFNECGPDINFLTECCYAINVGISNLPVPGRPLVIDDKIRLAPVIQSSKWSVGIRGEISLPSNTLQREHLVERWLEIAQLEHTSIASFAHFTLSLMAHGAPPELILESTRAQADELHHTQMCFEIASQLANKSYSPGPLELTGLAHVSIEALLEETIRDACINETLAAAEARFLSESACDHTIKSVLMTISEDEEQHAALGWKSIQWILEIRPDLIETAESLFKSAHQKCLSMPQSSEHSKWVLDYGVPDQPTAQYLQNKIWKQVILPCQKSLFANIKETASSKTDSSNENTMSIGQSNI